MNFKKSYKKASGYTPIRNQLYRRWQFKCKSAYNW